MPDIEKLRKELHAEIDRRCDEAKTEEKPWPQIDDAVYVLTSDGEIIQGTGRSSYAKDALKNYNLFRTREDAELAQKYRLAACRWAVTGWFPLTSSMLDYDKTMSAYRKMMRETYSQISKI